MILKIYLIAVILLAVLISAAFYFRKRKTGKLLSSIAFVAFMLLFIEFICLSGLKLKYGYWLFNEKRNPNSLLFQPHPYLGAIPTPGAHLTMCGKTYSHNSEGFRGKNINLANANHRIIALGGSTTYGTSVSDWQTWPYYLDSFLENKFEVLNFGVPGYSSVENIIQSELIVPEYKPDIIIIHTGLNDMRNYNVDGLQPDYSDYHAPSFYGSLGLCFENKLPRIATFRLTVLLLQKAGWYPVCSYSQMHLKAKSDNITDTFALHLYKRNLRTLVAVNKSNHIKVILVPQILVYESFKGNRLKWWIPFVNDDRMIKVLNSYNNIMEQVASEEGVVYAKEILNEKWGKDDFVDPSHLNAEANKKFAGILKNIILKIGN